MNLITKLAYNALTKTIQAIAPGGVSISVPIIATEYVSNGSTSTTASDTTSFLTGENGASIQSITADLTRRVRFPSAIKSSDLLFVEVSSGDGKWFAIAANVIFPGVARVENYYTQNALSYGLGMIVPVSGSNTDLDIRFGQYVANSGSAYGTAGDSYTPVASYKWRVRKFPGG
jgi:hypothetical protein